jgi:DNA (cytosine-5)-methyltransferase 1
MSEHPDLLDATRARLIAAGVPWVVENVPDAKLPNAITLCGSAFGLSAVGALDGIQRQLRRHRMFETNFLILGYPCQHKGEPIGVYGNGGPQRATRNRGYMGGKRERIEAMGIDWMDTRELSNAIPPAYTEYIGRHLIAALKPAGEAAR